MKSNANANQHRSNEDADLRLEDVDSFIEYMEGLLEELWGKINQLPKVDENGYSECPFAEELYAYKEEAAAIVAEESKKLQLCLELVKEEIDRCQQNIEILSTDASSLHLEEAKKKYEAGKKSQRLQYNKGVHQQELLIDLIKRADELLKLAEEKKWPIGEPGRSDRFNPEAVLEAALDGRFSALRDPDHIRPLPSRPAFGSEINNLLSLGPLG